MKARLIIPKAHGGSCTHDLAVHKSRSGGYVLKIVFATNEELFERWLFYFLRDVLGARIETAHPEAVAGALGLTSTEPGLVTVK